MKQQSVASTLSHMHQAFNTDAIEAINACYTDSAKVIAKPSDKAPNQNAHQALTEFRKKYAHNHLVTQGDEVVIEAGDVALVISKIYLSEKQNKANLPCEAQNAIYVFKRDEHGQWRCAIDNFFGTELLNYV